MNKEIIYTGNDLLNLNFGLYGYEDIDLNESKAKIKADFEENHKEEIIQELKDIGLKFVRFQWYSPRYYNFENDSLDIVLKVANKEKLKRAIQDNKEKLNKALSLNESYDGYMATTVSCSEEELLKLEKAGYEPDLLVIKTLTDFDFDFDIVDSLVNLEQLNLDELEA